MAIDPELAPYYDRLPRIDPSKGIVRALATVFGRVMPMKRAPGATLQKVKCGNGNARLHIPETGGDTSPRGALLWFHGGGLVMGHPRQDDPLCSEVAATLGIVVLAPQYRLAPRHKFPAALNDCREAWDWLLAEAARLGIDTARIAIGGDSAGGGLAACLVQSLCDERPRAVAAQWLFEPMLDDRTGADGSNDDPPEFFWKSADNRYGWSAYLGMPAGALDVPPYAVAARHENLAGLPQSWIGIGSEDLFLNECRTYAGQLEQAGCPVELVCAPGAPHGIFGLAPESGVAQRLRSSAITRLSRAINR